MVAHSTRTVPIVIASVIAVLLVGGAYALSGPLPFTTPKVDAQSSEELLKAYALKDSDSDGLKDWEEELYGTDPQNAHSHQADLTDGEVVAKGILTPKSVAPSEPDLNFPGTPAAPSSLTERFSQKFVGQYLLTRGTNPPTDEEMLRFVTSAVNELAAQATSTPTYTATDAIVISENTHETFTSYAINAEAAITSVAVKSGKTELAYLQEALENNDNSALEKLKEIADGYKAMAKALMNVPVPSSLLPEHVALANSFMYMSDATRDLTVFSDDPIRAFVGLGVYRSRLLDLSQVFINLDGIFTESDVTFTQGQPGFIFTSMLKGGAAIKASDTNTP